MQWDARQGHHLRGNGLCESLALPSQILQSPQAFSLHAAFGNDGRWDIARLTVRSGLSISCLGLQTQQGLR